MDKTEAHSVLAEHPARYRTRSYAELASRVRDGRVDTPEAIGNSGKHYQIETQFFWDDKADPEVRVIGSATDICIPTP